MPSMNVLEKALCLSLFFRLKQPAFLLPFGGYSEQGGSAVMSPTCLLGVRDRRGIQAVLTGSLPETGGTNPAKLSQAGSGLLITGRGNICV